MKFNEFRGRVLKGVVGKSPSFSNEEIKKCAEYFDLEFYRVASGKPKITFKGAILHYLTQGWRSGLDPSERFSTEAYLELYPDVAEAGVNPLLHYVLHGVDENRFIQRPEEGFEGRIDSLTDNQIIGWAVSNESRGKILPLRLFLNGTFYADIHNDQSRADLRASGLSAGQGGFVVDVPFHLLEPGPIDVEVELPDGSCFSETLEVLPQVNLRRDYRACALADAGTDAVKVVVPIYNAIEDVQVCIERLRAYTPDNVEIVLIDDCSPDVAIGKLLDSVKDEPQFRVLRNEDNLGFTRTINRGFNETGAADVIILNSDARVTPRWVEGMYAAAHARDNVATVTAMSDRAGAFSAPNIGNENPLPSGVDEITFAHAFRRRSVRVYPEVPTGNGFCMYIARSALDALGPLDEEAFPRGYGEENDFCMRALRAGWVNLIDDATYVFHDRSKSFGDEKTANMAAGRKIVDERYPEYKMLIGEYTNGAAINMARYRARLALADCTSGRGVLPRALFVLATRTGGTPQTNADLMDALEETFERLVLRCDSRELELALHRDGVSTVLRSHRLATAIEPIRHRSSEYDAVVSQWLAELDLDIVHIRHLGWHSLSLPKLASRAGARVVYSLHDFYTLCPSLKLIDDKGAFCGGTCTSGEGNCKVELWPSKAVPPLKNAWVHYWRSRMEEALSSCDAFVTTSPSARDRIASALPSIPAEHFHVIPHGRNFRRFETLQHMPNGDGPIRVLVPGNINKAKGLELLLELLELDRLGAFEFHIMGNVEKSVFQGKKPARLHMHGSYSRADFADKVRVIAPHFGVVFSVWDETYCHTLTEMWSVGLPVAVLDFPTLRMRVNDCGAGWVLEDMSPAAVYQNLCAIAEDRDDLAAKGKAAITWQTLRGTAQSCRQMASRYLDVYRGAKVGHENAKIGVVCPGNRNLKDAFASTEIRVWERTRNRLDRRMDYVRSTAPGLIAKMKMGTISGAILQRTAMPASIVDSFLETARETGTPYVFELDDQLLRVPSDKDPKGFYEAYAPYLERLIREAAALIVSTPALEEEMRPFNANIHCVENRISGRLWSDAAKPPLADTAPRLLYMGTMTHDEDLEFALGAIEIARKQVADLRLTLIGVTDREALPTWVDIIEVPAADRSYSSFVPWLRSLDSPVLMGIAPLVDSEFNRFKSDLKILDYGAMGLPVLASQVESYKSFDGPDIPDAVTLLPNKQDVWAREIVQKLESREDLHVDGERFRQWVFTNRRIEDNIAQYDEILARYIAA